MKIISCFAPIFAAISLPALAAANDFSLTYHVERFQTSALGLEDCANTAAGQAASAGLAVGVTNVPGQLSTVSGGATSSGAFVVQCIAVDDKTVAVVQGIDYRQSKGPLGQFADQVFAALQAAAR